MSTCRAQGVPAEVAQGSDPRRRIDVAVNSAMLAAIDLITERGRVSLTEAVRRLIGYGEAVYRAPTARGVRALRTLIERRRRETEERTRG